MGFGLRLIALTSLFVSHIKYYTTGSHKIAIHKKLVLEVIEI